MLIEISDCTSQLFAGTQLTTDDTDNCECTACNRILREGEPVTGYVTCEEDAATWQLHRLYCHECAPVEIITPTRGVTESLLRGRIACTMDVQTQQGFQVLHDIHLITTSPSTEDNVKRVADSTTDTDTTTSKDSNDTSELSSDIDLTVETAETVLIAPNSPLTTVYHLPSDEDDTTPRCRNQGMYKPIPLAEAEASGRRLCHPCRRAQQNHEYTHQCPHCQQRIRISVRPYRTQPQSQHTDTPAGDSQ